MKARIYYAEVVEEIINSLKQDYTNLMHKRMDEDNENGVTNASGALIALGILQDRILDLPINEIEL